MSQPILPLTSPQALTDTIFTNMGYFFGDSTAFQRNIAYSIAEWQVARQIGTYITPSIFTGTFPFITPDIVIQSPVGMILSIQSVRLFERWSNSVERIISGTSYIVDGYNGFFMLDISIGDISDCQNCSGQAEGIYKAEVVIQAGYPTGTAALPPVQLALCIAADIALKMMVDPGALPSGDDFIKTSQIGRYIQTVSDKFMYETTFGKSNMAQYIRTLLDGLSIRPPGKLGR